MPIVNISLDLFASIIVLILFLSSLFEKIKKESNSIFFPLLLGAIELTLLSDAIAWFCEGKPEYASWNSLGAALASVFAYLAITFFLLYLTNNLNVKKRATYIVVIFSIMLCILGATIHIFDLYHDFISYINAEGHHTYVKGTLNMIVQVVIPTICFISMVFIIFTAQGKSISDKIVHFISVLFPISGAVLDYSIHGYSLTYVGFVVFAVVLYTNIYLQKRRIIASQKTALMISQINPHFMYNTLTTIASLCDTDPKKAQNLTVGFSTYLRQNIDSLNQKSMIPFSKEMEHVETYLKIEKARFGDKFSVKYQLNAEAFALPPLTIQPIVENAIKHGITKSTRECTLKIVSYREKRYYVIDVIDDGVGFDTESPYDKEREHIGLFNVSSRLKAICNGKLEIKSNEGIGTRVSIKIPVRKARLDEHISSR